MAVKVKICGITNVEDAVAAAEFGADFIGLNFYPRSPRCINEDQATLILQFLAANVTPVALFVNEPWDRMREAAVRLGIGTVQVHADNLEPPPDQSLAWIPAFSVRHDSDFSELATVILGLVRDVSGCRILRLPSAILLDAHVPGAFGGTGRTAPWELIAKHRLTNTILAGGLTPDNVAEAIRIVRPWAVDVASGVESSPGKKDHDKMRRFIENARSAS